MSSEEASVHLSVVMGGMRRRYGMMLTREAARVRVDLAAELAMGRVVEVDEAGPAGFAWVDYFEDLPDEPEVARLM